MATYVYKCPGCGATISTPAPALVCPMVPCGADLSQTKPSVAK